MIITQGTSSLLQYKGLCSSEQFGVATAFITFTVRLWNCSKWFGRCPFRPHPVESGQQRLAFISDCQTGTRSAVRIVCFSALKLKTKASWCVVCSSFPHGKGENVVSWPNLPAKLDDPLKPTRGQCEAIVFTIREQKSLEKATSQGKKQGAIAN